MSADKAAPAAARDYQRESAERAATHAYDEYARLYRIAVRAKQDADAAYYRWFAARQKVPVQSRWPQEVER